MSEKAWKGLIIKSLSDKGFSNRKIKEIINHLEKISEVMNEAELEMIYAKD